MAYPAPPQTWAPYPYRRDPTAVMGRRIGAYLLGLLIGAVILTAILLAQRPWTRTANVPDASTFCRHYNNQNHRDPCINFTDHAYFILDSNRIEATSVAVYAGWFLLDAVVIEGLAGGKVGKLLLGLRVVRPDGQRVGVPRAFLRNILLIIPDQILVGLVGLVTALVTRGHKRVGDMVADTYVVDRASVGHEVVIDGVSSGQYPPPGPYGAPPQGPYGAPPTQPGAGTLGQGPGAGTWGTPQWPEKPSAEPMPQWPEKPSAEPMPQWPERPSAEPMPQWPERPSAEPAPQSPDTQPTAQAPGPAVPRREPVWDEARNTYLWWDDDKREWLEHDPQSGQWRPLSR